MTTRFTKSALLAATLCVPAVFAPAALAQGHTYNGYNNHNSYNAHEACKRDEQNDKVAAGLVGAVLGGVVGSQMAGNGARTEGSAIGAVLGGLAGAGIADKQTDCDPNYNHSYSGSTYGSQPTYHSNDTYYGNSSSYGTSQPYYGSSNTTYSNHGYTTTTYPSSRSYSRTTSYRTPSRVVTQPVRTVTSNVASAPRTVYRSAPVRTVTRVTQPVNHGTHYHGSYSCNGAH